LVDQEKIHLPILIQLERTHHPETKATPLLVLWIQIHQILEEAIVAGDRLMVVEDGVEDSLFT